MSFHKVKNNLLFPLFNGLGIFCFTEVKGHAVHPQSPWLRTSTSQTVLSSVLPHRMRESSSFHHSQLFELGGLSGFGFHDRAAAGVFLRTALLDCKIDYHPMLLSKKVASESNRQALFESLSAIEFKGKIRGGPLLPSMGIIPFAFSGDKVNCLGLSWGINVLRYGYLSLNMHLPTTMSRSTRVSHLSVRLSLKEGKVTSPLWAETTLASQVRSRNRRRPLVRSQNTAPSEGAASSSTPSAGLSTQGNTQAPPTQSTNSAQAIDEEAYKRFKTHARSSEKFFQQNPNDNEEVLRFERLALGLKKDRKYLYIVHDYRDEENNNHPHNLKNEIYLLLDKPDWETRKKIWQQECLDEGLQVINSTEKKHIVLRNKSASVSESIEAFDGVDSASKTDSMVSEVSSTSNQRMSLLLQQESRTQPSSSQGKDEDRSLTLQTPGPEGEAQEASVRSPPDGEATTSFNPLGPGISGSFSSDNVENDEGTDSTVQAEASPNQFRVGSSSGAEGEDLGSEPFHHDGEDSSEGNRAEPSFGPRFEPSSKSESCDVEVGSHRSSSTSSEEDSEEALTEEDSEGALTERSATLEGEIEPVVSLDFPVAGVLEAPTRALPSREGRIAEQPPSEAEEGFPSSCEGDSSENEAEAVGTHGSHVRAFVVDEEVAVERATSALSGVSFVVRDDRSSSPSSESNSDEIFTAPGASSEGPLAMKQHPETRVEPASEDSSHGARNDQSSSTPSSTGPTYRETEEPDATRASEKTGLGNETEAYRARPEENEGYTTATPETLEAVRSEASESFAEESAHRSEARASVGEGVAFKAGPSARSDASPMDSPEAGVSEALSRALVTREDRIGMQQPSEAGEASASIDEVDSDGGLTEPRTPLEGESARQPLSGIENASGNDGFLSAEDESFGAVLRYEADAFSVTEARADEANEGTYAVRPYESDEETESTEAASITGPEGIEEETTMPDETAEETKLPEYQFLTDELYSTLSAPILWNSENLDLELREKSNSFWLFLNDLLKSRTNQPGKTLRDILVEKKFQAEKAGGRGAKGAVDLIFEIARNADKEAKEEFFNPNEAFFRECFSAFNLVFTSHTSQIKEEFEGKEALLVEETTDPFDKAKTQTRLEGTLHHIAAAYGSDEYFSKLLHFMEKGGQYKTLWTDLGKAGDRTVKKTPLQCVPLNHSGANIFRRLLWFANKTGQQKECFSSLDARSFDFDLPEHETVNTPLYRMLKNKQYNSELFKLLFSCAQDSGSPERLVQTFQTYLLNNQANETKTVHSILYDFSFAARSNDKAPFKALIDFAKSLKGKAAAKDMVQCLMGPINASNYSFLHRSLVSTEEGRFFPGNLKIILDLLEELDQRDAIWSSLNLRRDDSGKDTPAQMLISKKYPHKNQGACIQLLRARAEAWGQLDRFFECFPTELANRSSNAS